MGDVVSGGCLCGGIRYECSGEVGAAGYCHCEDCRRCTGSAFNVGVHVDLDKFRIVSGEPKTFTKAADSGTRLTRHFCSDCGSPLYTSSPRHPDIIYVKAGSFDDPTVVKPDGQAWTDSAVSWAEIDAGLPSTPKNSG